MKRDRVIQRYAKAKPARKGYEIKAGVDSADVYIYDEVDDYWGISAKDFISELSGIKSPMTLHINTPGGQVFQGLAIYEAIKAFPYEVTARIEGLAASIGSIIALGAGKVFMARSAFYMIHRPWSLVVGDMDDMLKEAALLEKIGGTLLDVYEAKTGRKREELDGWMAAETWFTGDEALSAGFVDELFGSLPEDEDDFEDLARAEFDLTIFDKVPEALQKKEMPPVEIYDDRQKLMERRGKVYKALGWI